MNRVLLSTFHGTLQTFHSSDILIWHICCCFGGWCFRVTQFPDLPLTILIWEHGEVKLFEFIQWVQDEPVPLTKWFWCVCFFYFWSKKPKSALIPLSRKKTVSGVRGKDPSWTHRKTCLIFTPGVGVGFLDCGWSDTAWPSHWILALGMFPLGTQLAGPRPNDPVNIWLKVLDKLMADIQQQLQPGERTMTSPLSHHPLPAAVWDTTAKATWLSPASPKPQIIINYCSHLLVLEGWALIAAHRSLAQMFLSHVDAPVSRMVPYLYSS